ncbi:hypothetical protein N803_04995, partial [Knoellia subterranea KCTC 19937]
MSDVNWWLMLLSFLLGAIITWFWMVRRATREVPRTVVDRDRDFSVSGKAAGVGAGVAGAAAVGAAALRDRDVEADVDLDADADLTTRRADLDVDTPATEVYDRTIDEPTPSWDAPEANLPDVDAPEIDAPDLAVPDVEAPDVDVPAFDAAGFDAPDVEAPTVQRSSLDLPDVDAPDVDLPDVETPDVAGGVGGMAAGATGLAAASWASRSDDVDVPDADADAEFEATEPARFTGGATEVEPIDEPGFSAPGRPGDTSVMPMRDAGDLEAAQEAAVEEPVLEEPVVEEPLATETVAEEPVVEEPVLELSDDGGDIATADADLDAGSGAGGGLAAAGAGAAGVGAAVAAGKFGKGSADPAEDGSGPDGWIIKGNEDSMLFHTQDSPYYGRTKAEVWFDTEESARGAGFVRWDEKDRSGGSAGSGGAAKLVAIPEGKFGKGSADPAEDGSGPDGWTIKGNEDSNLYHTEESPYYGRTKAEIWFD